MLEPRRCSRATNTLLAIALLPFVLLSPQPATSAPTSSAAIEIRTIPSTPIVEVGQDNQFLNFDFAIRNKSTRALHLSQITLLAYDSADRVILIRKIDDNGFPSSLETIPNRNVSANGMLGVFNTLYAFPKNIDIDSLRYHITFDSAAGPQRVVCIVRPVKYADKSALSVPLKGHLLIIDGHDFYSHHRRQDLSNPEAVKLGVTANPVRYGLDFVFVDSTGAMYRGDSREKRNWFGYGKPVYAPASGRVVEIVSDVSEPSWDGRHLHIPSLPRDASPFGFGNNIVIDHGNGEFSILAHLMPGSISVKIGQVVEGGQMVGRLGASDAGDSTYPVEPHLHYTLMNGSVLAHSEGLPAYMGPFTLDQGATSTTIDRGPLDTGDIFDTK